MGSVRESSDQEDAEGFVFSVLFHHYLGRSYPFSSWLYFTIPCPCSPLSSCLPCSLLSCSSGPYCPSLRCSCLPCTNPCLPCTCPSLPCSCSCLPCSCCSCCPCLSYPRA